MTIQLHAQPYDMSATGFYFSTADEYEKAASANKNSFGDAVGEYEIQFIDGEAIDCALAKAWGLNQANFAEYLDVIDDWEDEDKIRYIIAVDECGYTRDDLADAPQRVDLTIYQCDSMRELAEQFVDEGVFGEVPEQLQFYIDYDAIARDLSVEYSETQIAGATFVYLCC